MITRLFTGDGDFTANLIQLLFRIPVMLISFTIHELAHGYAAYRLGDPTAKNLGRLTLNPIRHLDLIGGLMILFIGFGWAKPVPVNPRYFEKPKRDMALVSFAGPASNIILAFVGAFIYRIIGLGWQGMVERAGTTDSVPIIFVYFVMQFFSVLIVLNLSLAFFNLIPIPPLDGSKILDTVLPPKASYYYDQLSRYGFIIVILLINTPVLQYPLSFCISKTYTFFDFIINFIPFLRW